NCPRSIVKETCLSACTSWPSARRNSRLNPVATIMRWSVGPPMPSLPSASPRRLAPAREMREQERGQRIEHDGHRTEYQQRGKDAEDVGRAREHLHDLANPALRPQEFRDRLQSPRPRERNPDAAQDLRHRARNEHIPDRAAWAGTQSVGGVLVDRVEIVRGALRIDVEDHGDIDD